MLLHIAFSTMAHVQCGWDILGNTLENGLILADSGVDPRSGCRVAPILGLTLENTSGSHDFWDIPQKNHSTSNGSRPLHSTSFGTNSRVSPMVNSRIDPGKCFGLLQILG